jgi:hypothetical protein
MHLTLLKPATELLEVDLSEPLTEAHWNTSSKGTATNSLFGEDPIMPQYLPALSTWDYEHTHGAFVNAIKNVNGFFYHELVEKWVRLEADITYVTIHDQGFLLHTLSWLQRYVLGEHTGSTKMNSPTV